MDPQIIAIQGDTITPARTKEPTMPTPATRATLAALLAGEQDQIVPADQFDTPPADAKDITRHIHIEYRHATITRTDDGDDIYNEGKIYWSPRSLKVTVPWGDDEMDFLGDDSLPITDGYSIVDVIRAIDTWIDWSLVDGWNGVPR